MQTKSVPLVGVKAGPDDGLSEGEFIVYPSTWTREPDSYGDVVAKGAFTESIKAWKDSGDVMPGMYLHDPNQIVAEATDMGEDDHGWWVKGRFDDDPQSQRVYKWLKGRRLSSLSFGYQTLEEGKVELPDGKSANELRKLHSLEFSFLPKGFAANPDTSVVAVKTFTDLAAAELKAGRTLSKRNESALRDARDAIDTVLAALGDGDEEKSTDPGGVDDQEKQASGEPDAKLDASDEAHTGKSSASGEELKSRPSVSYLAAITDTYAVAYGTAGGGSQ